VIPESLHQALAEFGITSAKDERCAWNTRSLYMFGDFIGHFEAHAAWELVRDLRFGVDEAEDAA
jgi:hypothetical protein